MTMRVLGLGLFGLVVLVGCGKKKDDKGATPAGGAAGGKSSLVSSLEGLADKGCACKDLDCAAGVRKEVDTLAQGTGKVEDQDMAPLQKAQARLDECLAGLNPVIVSYRALVTKVCACADKACAEKVSLEFHQWAEDLKSSGTKMPARDAQVVMKSGLEAKTCLDKYGLPVPQ